MGTVQRRSGTRAC